MVKVSVIVPIYNGASYLPSFMEAINSIEFDDYEIIFIVAQKSSDNSVGAVREITAANKSMKNVVQTDETGSGGARNLGLDVATGEYIGFFDIDDIPTSSYISKMVGILDDTSSDVVFCNYAENRITECNLEPELKILTSKEAILSVTAGDLPGMPWGSMWRYNVIGKKRFIAGSTAEDTDFIIRCLTKTEKVAFYDHPLYIYNTRDMKGDPRQNCLSRAEVYYNIIDYLEETMPEVADEYTETALKVQLRWGAKRGGNEFVEMMNSDLLQKWRDRCKNRMFEIGVARNLPRSYCAVAKAVNKINSKFDLRVGKVG